MSMAASKFKLSTMRMTVMMGSHPMPCMKQHRARHRMMPTQTACDRSSSACAWLKRMKQHKARFRMMPTQATCKSSGLCKRMGVAETQGFGEPVCV
eukprot:1161279-Pelagomonas_calceolata.AAC.9